MSHQGFNCTYNLFAHTKFPQQSHDNRHTFCTVLKTEWKLPTSLTSNFGSAFSYQKTTHVREGRFDLGPTPTPVLFPRRAVPSSRL